jgi:hypothetical protein
MAGPNPERSWPARRVAALLLAPALATLGVYAWGTGVRDARLLLLIGVVSILGAIYAVNGGSLPPSVERASRWAGVRVNADDDPSNLSPKIYLPILAIVILAAAAAYYFYGPRR